jgi:hypothetical protein
LRFYQGEKRQGRERERRYINIKTEGEENYDVLFYLGAKREVLLLVVPSSNPSLTYNTLYLSRLH